MDSIPPATITSALPKMMLCAAMETAICYMISISMYSSHPCNINLPFMPEAHTLLTVVATVVSLRPAPRAA